MATISIVVPIYNVEPYLRKCVDSILAQTHTNIEVILVDDGSSDGCPEICDEYKAKDSRVVVIHQKNAGVSAARNAGLDVAKGEYIGFVDGDDWIEPEMYEVLYTVITASGADMVSASYTTDDKRCKKANSNEYISFSSREAMIKILNGQWELFYIWKSLFARNIIDSIRFSPSLTNTEDGQFAIRAIAGSGLIAQIDYQCYHYFIHGDSVCHAFNDGFWTTLNAIDMIIDVIKAYDEQFTDAADKCAIVYILNTSKEAESKGKFSKYAYKKVAANIRKYISASQRKRLSLNEKGWVCLLLLGRTPFIAGRKILRAFRKIRRIAAYL